jgi:RNA polymerase sigma factor (sigma-70 family)
MLRGVGDFPTTRFSAVRGLSNADAAVRERSWAVVTATYWRPVYKHLRLKWKKTPEDAEDLVQSFFADALERTFLAEYDPTKARFRTFLRVCADRHAANAARADARLKRGGGERVARAVDFEDAEAELAAARPTATPEELFDREWKRAVFASAIETLREECAAGGRLDTFVVFERYDLSSEADRPTYEQLAREHDVPVTTVTNRLSLARRELRRIVMSRLEELTATDRERDEEAHRIFGASS